ncbi:MAG: hypothetical protein HYZ74_02755 [Elusimicrobia bacterium]|nr:hypothetical protein [Elusimicrobiota bacterium]
MGGLILPRVGKGAAQDAEDSLDRFGQPLDYTYLTGLYLAVNAISDAAALIDGPDCVMGKAEHIHGKHDWRSTLLDCVGQHRIMFSGTDVRNAVLSREKAIKEVLLDLKDRKDIGVVLFSAMPMCLLTGTDYEKVTREVVEELGKSVVHVPSNSLRGFLLDGYAETLKALARSIELPKVARKADHVAIVGYFMDRLEQDHHANIEELKRLAGSLSLSVSSVWLAGGTLEQLSRVAEAGTVISLPYAREAARILAERTGARLLELDLPLGHAATRRWLDSVADACGLGPRPRARPEAEMQRVQAGLEAVRPYFEGLRCMLVLDPHMLSAVESFLTELGAVVSSRVSVGRLPEALRAGVDSLREPAILERPTAGRLRREWDRVRVQGVDLVIGNSDVRRMIDGECAVVELGYPSYFWHALAPQPALGFEGALALADRIVQALVKARAAGALPRRNIAVIGLEALGRTDVQRACDLAELHRLLRALGLTPVDSAWRAGTVLSLGRGAARAPRRQGRKGLALVSTEFPIGLARTENWLRRIGEELDCSALVEPLIDQEMRQAAQRLEWAIPFLFLNKTIAVRGGSRVARELKGLIEEVGASVHAGKAADADLGPVWPAQRPETLARPWVGFRGALCLLDELANAMTETMVAPLGGDPVSAE